MRRRIQRRMSPAVNLAECRAAVIDHSDMAEFFAPEVDTPPPPPKKKKKKKRTAADCAAVVTGTAAAASGVAAPSIVVPDELEERTRTPPTRT